MDHYRFLPSLQQQQQQQLVVRKEKCPSMMPLVRILLPFQAASIVHHPKYISFVFTILLYYYVIVVLKVDFFFFFGTLSLPFFSLSLSLHFFLPYETPKKKFKKKDRLGMGLFQYRILLAAGLVGFGFVVDYLDGWIRLDE